MFRLEEAKIHLRAAYLDMIKYYVDIGLTGIELLRVVNNEVKQQCNDVVEELMKER